MTWLEHVRRNEDGRLPKDVLYGELEDGKSPVGRPFLRFKDAFKRELSALNLPTEEWEALADDRECWWKGSTKGGYLGKPKSMTERRRNARKDTKMKLTEPSRPQQLPLHKHQSSPAARVGKCADPAVGLQSRAELQRLTHYMARIHGRTRLTLAYYSYY